MESKDKVLGPWGICPICKGDPLHCNCLAESMGGKIETDEEKFINESTWLEMIEYQIKCGDILSNPELNKMMTEAREAIKRLEPIVMKQRE